MDGKDHIASVLLGCAVTDSMNPSCEMTSTYHFVIKVCVFPSVFYCKLQHF